MENAVIFRFPLFFFASVSTPTADIAGVLHMIGSRVGVIQVGSAAMLAVEQLR